MKKLTKLEIALLALVLTVPLIVIAFHLGRLQEINLRNHYLKSETVSRDAYNYYLLTQCLKQKEVNQ